MKERKKKEKKERKSGYVLQSRNVDERLKGQMQRPAAKRDKAKIYLRRINIEKALTKPKPTRGTKYLTGQRVANNKDEDSQR